MARIRLVRVSWVLAALVALAGEPAGAEGPAPKAWPAPQHGPAPEQGPVPGQGPAPADTVKASEEPKGASGMMDPNPSRLFVSPTGRALGRGTGYIANYMLFFPFAAYGITDRISLAGGTPILPDVTGEVFYLVPQVTVVIRPRASVSVGALSLFVTREVGRGSAGLLYGAASFGDRDRALTAGAGWGFALASDAYLSDEPVVMVGGEYRVGERTKLLTENWAAPVSSSSAILTGGLRFFGERISADLGVGGGPGVGCCLPVANFVYNFGR